MIDSILEHEQETAYRGDGADRPRDIPLPPTPMPLFYGGRLRKLWRYVSIWSQEISVCAANVYVGPVAQEFWAVWDRAGKRLYEHTRLWVGRVSVPVGEGRVLVRDGKTHIDIRLDEDSHDRGKFEVVTRSGSAYTWTRKWGGIRAHGFVRIGGQELKVEARALIDDNAGYHPRNTRWQWSGGAGFDVNGRSVAWSVIVGLNDSHQNSERTLWIDGVPQEVGPVQFADDLSAVTFSDGSALRFTAEATRQRHDNLLLIRSAYRQPFGEFSGTLPGGVRLANGYGVMEYHEALW